MTNRSAWNRICNYVEKQDHPVGIKEILDTQNIAWAQVFLNRVERSVVLEHSYGEGWTVRPDWRQRLRSPQFSQN